MFLFFGVAWFFLSLHVLSQGVGVTGFLTVSIIGLYTVGLFFMQYRVKQRVIWHIVFLTVIAIAFYSLATNFSFMGLRMWNLLVIMLVYAWIGDLMNWADARRRRLLSEGKIDRNTPLKSDWVRPTLILLGFYILMLMCGFGAWGIAGSSTVWIVVVGWVYLLVAIRGFFAKYIVLDIVIGASLVFLTIVTFIDRPDNDWVLIMGLYFLPVAFRLLFLDMGHHNILNYSRIYLNPHELRALDTALGIKPQPITDYVPVVEEAKTELVTMKVNGKKVKKRVKKENKGG